MCRLILLIAPRQRHRTVALNDQSQSDLLRRLRLNGGEIGYNSLRAIAHAKD